MKKITLIAALVLSATVYGQKGSWYLGGNAGFSMTSSTYGGTTVKESSWSASPEIGTFLTDHIQLGLGITSSGSFRDITGNTDLKTLQFGGTLYSRYLFGERALRPFLGISASYLSGESKMTNMFTNRVSTINVNFTAGFAYYVTPRLGFFGSIGMLGYTNSRAAQYGDSQLLITNDFGFSASTLGNRITVGIYYTICQGKAKE
jgi:hypothetical protein